MAKCPKCKSEVSYYLSCCFDPECCGLAHDITCNNCYFTYEWDDETLKDKWVELGGDKDEF